MATTLTKTQLLHPDTTEVQNRIATLTLTGAPKPLFLGHSLDAFAKDDITPTIGTQFARGVQISSLLKAENADELIRDLAVLISQRGVVFFWEQDLTIAEQKVLGTKLGELTGKPASSKLHIHPSAEGNLPEDEEVSVISPKRLRGDRTRKPDSSTFAANGWHSDITFEPVPSDYAILKVHKVPEINGQVTGGDTLWASGYEVYDRLSPSFARYLETLEVVHQASFVAKLQAGDPSGLVDKERGSPGNIGRELEAIHPLIRTNPVTGWKSVFVNPGHTKRIVGVTKDESDVVLKHLYNLIKLNHDLQVRFKWEKNSVAIWDNRSTYHNVTRDYGEVQREGNRVVSLGERPYFDPASKSRREALGITA